MTKTNKVKVARIDSIITDQGNGGSYCSECGIAISLDPVPKTCPGCGLPLIFGDVYINQGGSDF